MDRVRNILLPNSLLSTLSSIGPGGDSFYEYLLKCYIAFGSKELLDMFWAVVW